MSYDGLYWAWVNEGEEFDEDVHLREDEDIYDLEFDHSEGDFAGLKLVVRNPRIGLLNTSAGRKVWGILSYSDGDTVTPIFRGRLLGVPSNVFETLVTLDFTARPYDFDEQKLELAETLKVLPYYDSSCISPDSWGDPDVVLEARSSLWHIDPVTHVVTISSIITPEDGVEEVTEDDHFRDEMSLTLNQVPVRAVTMICTIPWTQTALGGLDLGPALRDMWPDRVVKSFTLQGLIDSWPKAGSGFGSGWEVTSGGLADFSNSMPKMVVPDIFSWQGAVPIIPEGSVIFPLKVTGEYHSGEKAGFNFQYSLVVATLGYGYPTLTVNYNAGRELGQIVTFTLRSDQQDIVTLPGDSEVMTITLTANKVSDPTEDGSIPIGDVRRRDYVHTARGIMTMEYLLLVTRAHVIAKSRAVETEFTMSFRDALRCLSLRKGALLHDHRLPGGQATGKIIGSKLRVSGESGEAIGVITIASCVGKGGSHTTSAGTPTYVDEGYMDNTQVYTNVITLTDTSDIAWSIPDFVPFDDGLDFMSGLTRWNALNLLTLSGSESEQRGYIESAGEGPNTDQAKVSSVLQEHPTQITAQLKPMEGGPFTQEVVLAVSDLIVPQQINLEAASNA